MSDASESGDRVRRLPDASDVLEVRGIRAYGRHGAEPVERERAQPFDVSLSIELDLQRARRSDQLADTLDYAALHARVVRIVGSRSYALLERLGDEILCDVMSDPRILAAKITLAKPGRLDGATPAVTLRQRRSDR